jgi:pilus assembly protein CpaE
MSGAQSDISVLLPAARVNLFARNKDTVEAFRALQKDWRFARVTLDVSEGSVTEAATFYESYESPELVIVETDTIDGSFVEQLEILASNCAQGTSAIVIGPVNDVNLYRRLVAMGVNDYLVRPVTTHSLANDIGKSLITKMGAAGSHLIAVIGAKGGVGVSALTIGMAWGVSESLGQKTIILDAAGSSSSLSVGLDTEPVATLADAVKAVAGNKVDQITRMIHKSSERLFVLSSGGDAMLDNGVDAERYEGLLDYLMGIYPVVLVDLSSSSPAVRRAVLAKAQETIVVTTPTLPSLRAARTLMGEISQLRGGGKDDRGVDLVVNMVGISGKHEVPKSHIEKALEHKPAAIIAFAPDLFLKTEGEAKRLNTEKDGAAIVADLVALAQKTVPKIGNDAEAATEEKSGGLGGLLGKLKKS